MAISYPLTFPTTFGVASIRMIPRTTVGRTVSLFTKEQQIYEWSGEYWEVEVELLPMPASIAAPVRAFFASLRGLLGTFLFGPVDPKLGTSSGVTVDGAGQTGKAIALTGTGSIKAGDFFQLGSAATSRLYMNDGADVTLAGTVDIFPRLRETPANGATVVVASPKGLFRLLEPVGWDIETKLIYGGFRFRAMEAI